MVKVSAIYLKKNLTEFFTDITNSKNLGRGSGSPPQAHTKPGFLREAGTHTPLFAQIAHKINSGGNRAATRAIFAQISIIGAVFLGPEGHLIAADGRV